ncbi:MAG TPA: 16S rRNA (cytosine(1402)-N(4))-methyltransferase RsmH [Oceanospirillales bacterium]|nr:16S rRNA (cytosine(1402)-N(4))-methyltransferase RsmH [Oceanospirillales bacterium]
MNGKHETVLLSAAVAALKIKASGDYIDATFGRGGHSKEILKHLGDDQTQGRLLVIDRDPAAIKEAHVLAQQDKRIIVEHGAFEMLDEMIARNFNKKVDGILFDLGISSPQIDQAQRGFSFNQDGPLDMRMDTSTGETAAQWLNRADWKEMSKVFWRYGEEKNATKIAKEIVIYREDVKPLEMTGELVEIIAKINRYSKKHPATRTFQAIRIHLNRELEQIEKVLPVALKHLNKGGRLVVISFHSLEDRIVKRFMKKQSSLGSFDKRMPIAPETQASIKIIGKTIKASLAELENNPRARSAIMRIAEKL